MRKLIAFTASVATSVVLAACATSSATPATTTAAPVVPPPAGTVSATTPVAATWHASLQSMNGTDVTGRATVIPSPGGSTATVTLESASPGAVHPWHIHNGTCAGGGGVVGPASAYNSLSVTPAGRARATAEIPITLDPTQSYHVNVHQSSSDMGNIVACGNLTATKS